MKILSVNAGSSSLKFTLIELPDEKVIISGTFEKIGLPDSFYTIKYNGNKDKKEVLLKDHTDAVKYLLDELINYKVINSLIIFLYSFFVNLLILYKESINDFIICFSILLTTSSLNI